jgi:hypothetical protein
VRRTGPPQRVNTNWRSSGRPTSRPLYTRATQVRRIISAGKVQVALDRQLRDHEVVAVPGHPQGRRAHRWHEEVARAADVRRRDAGTGPTRTGIDWRIDPYWIQTRPLPY